MIPRFFLIAALAAPAGLLAQNPAVAPSQASQGSTIVVPPTNIYVVGGGLYGTGVYVGQPAVAVAPPLNTGISLASHTGISFNQPVESSAGAMPGYAVYSSYPSVAVETSGRLINDVGPSYFADSGANTGEARAGSLGEVAAQYKANRPQTIRTYTNADAEQLANRVTIVGRSQPSSGTQSRIAQNRPEPATNVPEKAEPVASATTPTVGPENAAPEPATNRLPATSTLLPLLGLLGVASGAIGLWLRKFLR